MAATNAINLYITTCRYIIQSTPYDPETWTELYRYLPYLRQSLSCCVCAQILHIPMGPIESPCQHHVCKDCVGGKMRLKPTCSWCKDFGEFVENPIIRTVIQCFKKLCEYLASSAIAINIENTNNGSTNALRTVIQDGVAIKDEYSSPIGPQLGLFPPKLHKVSSRRASKEEQTAQCSEQTSNCEQGQGHCEGSGSSINCDQNGASGSLENKSAPPVIDIVPPIEARSEGIHVDNDIKETENKKPPDPPCELKANRKRKRGSDSGRKEKSKQRHTNGHKFAYDENGTENSLYETVAAEHDYNKDSSESDNPNAILKVRIRKVEGDHESLIKRPKTVNAEPILPHSPMTNDEDSNEKSESPVINNNNNDSTVQASLEGDQNKKKKKPIIGCRCGLATPNPGKLTCCGQRCPCYSSFKGCIECKCRGCRNPRGDKPSPNSLKVQLQQQNLTTQSLLPLTSSNPQLILTPIKMDPMSDSDVEVDMC